jgi:hypothetical protein
MRESKEKKIWLSRSFQPRRGVSIQVNEARRARLVFLGDRTWGIKDGKVEKHSWRLNRKKKKYFKFVWMDHD